MSSSENQVRDLARRWAAAEVAGDTTALDALACADFRLVGPAGFVLDKQQWLDRYRDGALVTTSLTFADLDTRACGPATITIGVQAQEAAYRGQPASGRFRVTAVTVGDGGGGPRRLAGVHLSALAGPSAATATEDPDS
jgi:hypothetical protein